MFDISQNAVSLCVFAAVAAGVYSALAILDPYWIRVRHRVRDLELVEAGTSNGVKRARDHAWQWDAVVCTLLDADSLTNALNKRLARAGIYHPNAPLRFLGARLLCIALPPLTALSLALIGALPIDKALLAGCLLSGLGSLAPGVWIDRLAARYQTELRISLPDFLDLMVVCLEGGLSLQETIRRVSDELRLAHPSLAAELCIVQRDVELGASIDQALKRFAQRTDCDGVRSLSTFIREAQRFGTNITEALRTHAEALRSQREQAAEENAQKAAVKVLVPTILLIFPAIFIVLVGPAAVQIYTAFGQQSPVGEMTSE